MNLVVDVGNTRFKYAFFENSRLKQMGFEENEMFRKLAELNARGEKVSVLLSGSGRIREELRMEIRRNAVYWKEAGVQMGLPVEIDYLTPETLGFDRIAICVGARRLFPDKDLLVIDSGTAITFNYVTAGGRFLGGNISPGQEIRFRALHLFTEKLPYVEGKMEYGWCGKNTEEAIRNGVMNSMVYEVNGYIDAFIRMYPKGQVIVTGGNSLFLKQQLLESVCFEEYLGLQGLNEILEYNKKYN